MIFEAYRAYDNADVWAVAPSGTTRAHVMVFPINGVVAGLRAQAIADYLNKLHADDNSAEGREFTRGGFA